MMDVYSINSKHYQRITLHSFSVRIVTSLCILFAGFLLPACTQSRCPEESSLYGKMNQEIICYRNQQEKHGVHVRWHTGGKHKKFERSYDHNILDGSYKEWYSNGQLKLSLNYNRGQLDGSYQRWFSNGQIHIKTRYSDNTRVGPFLEYYKNGRKRFEYNYDALGKFEGDQIEYRLNGYKLRKRVYTQGRLIGKMSWNLRGRMDPVLNF